MKRWLLPAFLMIMAGTQVQAGTRSTGATRVCEIALLSLGGPSGPSGSTEEQIANVYRMLLEAGLQSSGDHRKLIVEIQNNSGAEAGLDLFFSLGALRDSADAILQDGLTELGRFALISGADTQKLREALKRELKGLSTRLDYEGSVRSEKVRVHAQTEDFNLLQAKIGDQSKTDYTHLAAAGTLENGEPAIFSLPRPTHDSFGDVEVRDPATGEVRKTIVTTGLGHSTFHMPSTIEALRDGRFLIKTFAEGYYVFSGTSYQKIPQLKEGGVPFRTTTVEGPKALLLGEAAARRGHVNLIEADLASGESVFLKWPQDGRLNFVPYDMTYLPGAKRVVATGSGGVAVFEFGEPNREALKLIDYVNGPGFMGTIDTRIHSSIDGTLVVVNVLETTKIYRLDSATGKIVGKPMDVPPEAGGGLAESWISPDGRWVVTRYPENRLNLFDVKNQKTVFRSQTTEKFSLSWFPDSTRFLLVGQHGNLRVGDIAILLSRSGVEP